MKQKAFATRGSATELPYLPSRSHSRAQALPVGRHDMEKRRAEMRKAAKKWYKQAIHELEMAEKNIAIGGYDVASFLSHQAAKRVLAFFEAKWGSL